MCQSHLIKKKQTEDLFYSKTIVFYYPFDSSILFRVLNEQFNSWLRENGIDTTGKQQMEVIVIIMVTFIKNKI